MSHLSMSRSSDQPFDVRYVPRGGGDWDVQVFLGSSYQTLYMSVEEARSFAESLLAAIPAPAEAEA
jgi:hypothetical protein